MHKPFLLAALENAIRGRGRCSPNPSVGAVAVQYGKIIAQSYHHGAGSPHAEALLMQQFPANTPDVTLYVTLEPCNHWGKTPPCVDAIIKQGISRVVFSYRDPNPVVAGKNTPNLLIKQGIDVIHYPMPEIDLFYRSYQHWWKTKTPWVTVKIAQTFDGKIAGKHGARVQLSNDECREFTHQQRKLCDIILTTAKTINQDDPQLNVRLRDYEQTKPVAIIDRQRTINASSKVLLNANICHIYHDGKQLPTLARDNCAWHTVSTVTNKNHQPVLDLLEIVTHLGQLGYHDVWVEAGACLFNALHETNLANKTYIYLVPKVLGEEATSLYSSQAIYQQAHGLTWHAMGDNMIVSLDWNNSKESVCLPA